MLIMGSIISYAFSYSSHTSQNLNINPKDELEKPYQTFMLLLMISSVAMIMEYLILVPEYMSERKIFLNERKVRPLKILTLTYKNLLTIPSPASYNI